MSEPKPPQQSKWDCRLCETANDPGKEICGYCGNPVSANETLPPLPRKRVLRRTTARVRPYARRLAPSPPKLPRVLETTENSPLPVPAGGGLREGSAGFFSIRPPHRGGGHAFSRVAAALDGVSLYPVGWSLPALHP